MENEFVELYKKYGFDNPNKSRDDLSEAEERNLVNDSFGAYEHIGMVLIWSVCLCGISSLKTEI